MQKGVSRMHVVFIRTLLHQCSIHICNSEPSDRAELAHCLFAPSPVIHKFPVCLLSVYCLSVCVKHDCFGSQRNFVEWACPSDEQDASLLLLCCTLCVHGHSYTPIPVPALVWLLEFAPTNRPLNLTHIQTYKQPEPPGVPPLTSYLSVCLATTLIGQPSNPHQFLGSQLDSPEPMRCRRGRWTWESPNQIPRSDQSRSLFCCMSYVWWLWPI